MSGQERVCKNCGTIVPVGMRNCPKCNRLFIDSSRERLYSPDAAPPPAAASTEMQAKKKETAATSPVPAAGEDAAQTSSSDSAEVPEDEPKIGSYYGVAPIANPPPYDTSPSSTGPSTTTGSSGGGGCHICAVLFIVISTIIQLVALVV